MEGFQEVIPVCRYDYAPPAVRVEVLPVAVHEVQVPGMDEYLEISRLIYTSLGRRFGMVARLREAWRWLTGRE